MTLRTRLTAAFLAVVLGPVLAGAVFLAYTVGTVNQDRSTHRLDAAANAVRTSVAGWCEQLGSTADILAALPSARRTALSEELVRRGQIGGVRILSDDGTPIHTTEGAPPQPWTDCQQPTGDSAGGVRAGTNPVSADEPASPDSAGVDSDGAASGDADSTGGSVAPVVAARSPLPEDRAVVQVAARVDQGLVERLAAETGVAVTLVGRDGASVHTTDEAVEGALAAADGLAPGQVTESTNGRWVRQLAPEEEQPLVLVLTTGGDTPVALYPILTGTVVFAAVAGALLAWRLGHATTRPLAQLARATDRVAEGDLSVRVPVHGTDETGRLAVTFNRMTHRMQSYVQALTTSRDQLRRHLTVLGDTLSSTHDLDRILRVTLRTALATTAASGGAVLLVNEQDRTLVGHCVRDEPPPTAGARPEAVRRPLTVPVGEGLLGRVAATGEPQRGRATAGAPERHEAEPECRTFMVVPISAPGAVPIAAAQWPVPPGVRGVLALYDRLGGDEFDDTDLVTLQTFAGQAGVAVDNVRTHDEAQRLSLTDPLTGLWNYRSLQDAMRREVERANRFDHPLAVLMLDLDRFKETNDEYGHGAGDTVLAEFARRVRSVIREVDLAFRHGGEEFVVVLPETDSSGATVLAQRLGTVVRDRPVSIAARGTDGGDGGLEIAVTVSVGIAVYPEHARTPAALLEAADNALYAAKSAGRDTCRVASGAPEPVPAAELAVRAQRRTPPDGQPRAGGAGGDVTECGDAGGGAHSPRQGHSR